MMIHDETLHDILVQQGYEKWIIYGLNSGISTNVWNTIIDHSAWLIVFGKLF